MSGTGADVAANTAYGVLTAGVTFTVPTVTLTGTTFDQPDTTGALYATINPIDIGDLTTGLVEGTGAFDKLMTSLTAHLKVEYQANRISGAEYTKAYIGIVAAALQMAQQFVLGKEQAYWASMLVAEQAKAAAAQAVTARLELEVARVSVARMQFEAETAKVNYSLTKIKLATEDATYDQLTKQNANLVTEGANLVITGANLTKQGTLLTSQNLAVVQDTAKALAEKNLIEQQDANLVLQGVGISYTNSNILPKQLLLIGEQAEVQRAQTSDKRTDGTTTVAGAVGKQKALYDQQIESYQRDAEVKLGKIFSDAWITQKTIDEGLTAPTQFANTAVNDVMTKLRTSHGIS